MLEPENSGLERVRHELRARGVKHANNPQRSGIHSRGYLPHVKRESADYFVTFRLADSLPKEVLLRYAREKAKRIQAFHTAKRVGRGTDQNRAIYQNKPITRSADIIVRSGRRTDDHIAKIEGTNLI